MALASHVFNEGIFSVWAFRWCRFRYVILALSAIRLWDVKVRLPYSRSRFTSEDQDDEASPCVAGARLCAKMKLDEHQWSPDAPRLPAAPKFMPTDSE